MKRKTKLGMFVFIAISFIPLIPWYFLSPVRDLGFTYENITHSLGQIAALVGMTMFAITFVLSTRLKFIEKIIGGLDKVYVVHSILGSVSFMLLLVHPILLILKFIPSRPDLAAKYLLPGHGFSVDMGIIALVGMIILLSVTFYINMKYNYWKMSHKFLGLFFMIAVLHTFLVRGTASRDYIFEGYYIYAGIVSALGIIAFIYSSFIKSIDSTLYKVKSINKFKGEIYDVILSPVRKPLRYKAGQFAFFRFHNRKLGIEYHPFTMASSTNNPEIRIVMKTLGDFTSKLDNLEVDNRVSVEGPYGEFKIKDRSKDMTWVGGGIGITPFMGMAKDLLTIEHTGRITLYWTAKSEEDFMVIDELKTIEQSKNSNFQVIPWYSRKYGKISLQDMKSIHKNSDVYLCGPEGFKTSLKKQLKKYGISKEHIYDERFEFK